MQVRTSVVVAGLLLCWTLSQATAIKINFNDIKDKWNKGINFASDLLGGDGRMSRGNGCDITWNIHATTVVKWRCVCADTCTGITEVKTKKSRDGSLEHCVEALFRKLATRGEL